MKSSGISRWPLCRILAAAAISAASARSSSVPGRSAAGMAFPSARALLLEHDLFRKPVPTFRDHALVGRFGSPHPLAGQVLVGQVLPGQVRNAGFSTKATIDQ